MTNVLVVGAGPTGLTLAVDLARRGVSCRVIDKEVTFPAGSRGRGMQPRTQEVFDDLGLIEAVHAHGSVYPPIRAYQGGEVVWEGTMSEYVEPSADVPYPNPWMIPQWRTAQLLRDRLAEFGGAVETGTELVGFEQDEDGVAATLRRDGVNERVRVAYLVGADGGKGPTRRMLGVPFDGETRDDIRMLIADVRVEGLDRDHWHLWREPMIGLCPLGGTDSFQLTIADPDRELSTIEQLAAYFAERTGRTDLGLSGLTWLTVWRPNVRMTSRFQVGRVFLAGDAAHVHPPSGGQGMNTGVQDAYNLGWKLAAVLRGAPEVLLDSYEQERLPVAAHVLGLSERLLARRTMHRGHEERQLGITYQDGPLAVDDRPSPGSVVAGDRAPDGPCGDGRRLFDVFRGPHATVLAFGAECEGAVRVTDPEAFRIYDVEPGTLVLVRPDGYIGVITRDAGRLGSTGWYSRDAAMVS
ncbi:2-polyprenyl-6-methoxyphenol hydroxylase-like FAD-dependent oxidoreductase [Kibdelosporangium banguiense]|uniref:2-polyprenyl-6-methoxyphenol hydroxylase-like FAD-dependent oxidoreductase n=1 Tax=Kibdelosporangium banguiense TaxID=1365924 RepID=A0ABS4TT05_9PSEU|nr:FAD-dependent monooxygenase [Kibdelosporangium banguiense]MBP2327524.1 2-polyprenyl-6-methoxyphenol hydroxylase-like FAD-dependent oxidoreductase [Kibdelosporangium banguiense]